MSTELVMRQHINNTLFEIYDVGNNGLRHRITIGGKLVLEEFATKIIPYLSLCQRAYYHVYVWDDSIHLKDNTERESLLEQLQQVAREFSTQPLRPTGSHCVMLDIKGRSVKCMRFYLQDQDVVRSYYSVLTHTRPAGMDMEHRHVITEMTDIHIRPTPMVDMAATLISHLPHYA